MNTLAIGDLKTRFSEVIKGVQKGEEVIISYGKKKEKVAVLIPYFRYKGKKRALGLLQKSTVQWDENSKLSDQDFLNS